MSFTIPPVSVETRWRLISDGIEGETGLISYYSNGRLMNWHRITP